MKTYLGQLLLEVDGGSIGDMLETLQAFCNSTTGTDKVRVLGFQWDGPKDEKMVQLDIRDPGWKSLLNKPVR